MEWRRRAGEEVADRPCHCVALLGAAVAFKEMEMKVGGILLVDLLQTG